MNELKIDETFWKFYLKKEKYTSGPGNKLITNYYRGET